LPFQLMGVSTLFLKPRGVEKSRLGVVEENS
jgi:hypothetical protein